MSIRYKYNIGKLQKIVATKPNDILNRYVFGQIYIFDKQWLKILLDICLSKT